MIGVTGSVLSWWFLLFGPAADVPLHADHACGLQPPDMVVGLPPVPDKDAQPSSFEGAKAFVQRIDPQAGDGQVQGALSGKTVYLSAGHGLTWTGSAWRTQRGNTNGIVEDLVSIEAVNQYLIPYLHAMGAYVVTVREPDLRAERIIVDDPDAVLQGDVQELSGGSGWGPVALPMTSNDVAPFDAGSSRLLTASQGGTGELVYAPAIPQSGHYNVYISFVQGADRVPDAHYVVRHSGGETHFRIDQRRHGSTWVLLGRFHFDAAAGPEAASVAILDDSSQPGAVISADAVRFGGGLAVHDRGGGDNGRPLYEQSARYYTHYSGAPSSVFAAFADDGTSDVSARSRFAAWEHEDGEDAVYVAWHSNAPNPRVGTSSYTYGNSPPPGSLSNFSGVAGSRELQDFIHLEIIDDLRAGWDPNWADEGRFTAYFGEVNPNHNPEMPAVLLEVAYHDTPSDAEQLRDPQFRRIVSRAIAQGIARYFADADGSALTLPPEPPRAVWVTQDEPGTSLTVHWEPPEPEPGQGGAPTSWLVQVSDNGLGFDEGTATEQTSSSIDGLTEGDVVYVRIVGVNEGGRSLPSQVVGAAVAPSGRASALIVGGFDRLDGGLLLQEDLSAFALATVDRMWLHRMNDGSYAHRHGQAIADAGFSFDGATDDAIEGGHVTLGEYQAVDWFCGEDSVGDDPLSALARDALTDYLDGGGRLFVSGAELGWALDEFGTPDEQAFFHEQLRARYLLDDAETYEVAGQGEIFAGLSLSFEDPTAYDPRYPDVLEPEADSEIVFAYQGGTGVGAGVAFGFDDPGARGVLLGFPFETIADETVRAEIMIRLFDFFEVQEAPPPDDGGTTGGDDGGSDGGDGGTSGGDEPTSGGPMEPDTDTDGGQPEQGGDDGCGCRATEPRSGGRFGLWALFVVLGAVARGRVRARRA